MKTLYHICYTSHNEVLCRNINDYETVLCRMAQTSLTSDSSILAYAIMSNHVHIVLLTDNPAKFVSRMRQSYTKTFNYKYHRKGRLGEQGFFSIEISNPTHIATAISYVLRNPVHHQVSTNPFDYPFSSATLYFRGKGRNHARINGKDIANRNIEGLFDRHKKKAIYAELPFFISGGIDPATFVEAAFVERCFGTYNAFQYFIHRRDYDTWRKEQIDAAPDMNPITIKQIEPLYYNKSLSEYIKSGKWWSWSRNESLTDIELCSIIDNKILPQLRKPSYAVLTQDERMLVASNLISKNHFNQEQVFRCLGLNNI